MNCFISLGLSISFFSTQLLAAAESKDTNTKAVDHSKMHHSEHPSEEAVDHSKMHHGEHPSEEAVDHSKMHHGSPPDPSNLRDPHAYSGGYTSHQNPYVKEGVGAHLHEASKLYWTLGLERLETQIAKSKEATQAFEARAWLGDSLDKALVLSEGHAEAGHLEESETELLWSHAIHPYWDSVVGLRYDASPEEQKSALSFGFRGLAPFWFETNLRLFLSKEAELGLKFETEYELLFTQTLILTPRFEYEAQNLNETGEMKIASHNIALGLRLRYEITRQIAPYIGVEWTQQKLGETTGPMQGKGLIGLKFWI